MSSVRYDLEGPVVNPQEEVTDLKILQQDHKGYNKIHRYILEESMPDWRDRTYINTIVKTIDYGKDGVIAYTTKGTYKAKYVITTFSIGVLQNNEVEFVPELPQWKQEAIAGFLPEVEFVTFASKNRGYYPIWQNLEKMIPGCRITQGSVLNTEAERVATLSDKEIQTEAMAVIRKMFGKDIPDPVEITFPRWASDPLFHGSYGNWPVRYLRSTHDALRAPVGRVHFTVDAYSYDYYGYLHGALESGQQTANDVIACLNSSKK